MIRKFSKQFLVFTILSQAMLSFSAFSDDDQIIKLVDLKPITSKSGISLRNPSEASFREKTITIGDVQCDETIFAHANSLVEFEIPKNAQKFTATGVGMKHRKSNYGVYAYIVKIDGEEMFKSDNIRKYKDEIVNIEVEIPEGSKIIQLITDNLGSNDLDHSTWCYPRLHVKPVPVQANHDPISQKYIAILNKKLDSYKDKLDELYEDIDKKTISALDDAMGKATKAAKLDEALKIKDAIKSIKSDTEIDLNEHNGYLRRILQKRAAEREKCLKKYNHFVFKTKEECCEKLSEELEKLTKAGKLEDAVKVRDTLKNIQEVVNARERKIEQEKKKRREAFIEDRLEQTWNVIFKSSDPTIFGKAYKDHDNFSVDANRIPRDMRYLKLTRMDTGEYVIIPLKKDDLLRKTDVGDGIIWNGTKKKIKTILKGRDMISYFLGIASKKWTAGYKASFPILTREGGSRSNGCSGWGFARNPVVYSNQAYAWNGKSIKKTKFQISVKATSLHNTEKQYLLTINNEQNATARTGSADQRGSAWKVIYKSDDPEIWGVETDENGNFFIKKYRIPSSMKYLRLKRLDNDDYKIIPLNKKDLFEYVKINDRTYWDGTIFGKDKEKKNRIPQMLGIVSMDGKERTSGIGKTHTYPQSDYYIWDGRSIKKTMFEISVACEILTQEEKKKLIYQ